MAISKTWVMFTLIKGHIRPKNKKKSQVQSWQTAISETKVKFSHDKRPYHKQEWSQVMTNSHIRNKHHFQSWQTAMSEIRVRFSLDKQQWKKKKKHTHTHTQKKKKEEEEKKENTSLLLLRTEEKSTTLSLFFTSLLHSFVWNSPPSHSLLTVYFLKLSWRQCVFFENANGGKK